MPADILLSVIVPVFNVRPYLEALIGTVLPRLRENCECIFVDDGSTDGSVEFVEQALAASSAANTRLIKHERNRGLSAARNTGLAEAHGKYTWFLDSDDALMRNAIDDVLAVLTGEDVDLLIFDHARMWERVGVAVARDENGAQFTVGPEFSFDLAVPRTCLVPNALTTSRSDIVRSMLFDMRFFAAQHVVSTALCRRFPFPEGKVFEDISTVPLWMLSANGLYYLPRPLIVYRQRPGSILASHNVSKYLDLARSFRPVIEFYRQLVPEGPAEELDLLYAAQLQTLYWAARDLLSSGLFGEPGVKAAIDKELREFRAAVGPRLSDVVRLFETPIEGRGTRGLHLLVRSLSLFAFFGRIRLSRVGRAALFLRRV